MSNGVWTQSGIFFNLSSWSLGYTAVGATPSTQYIGQEWTPSTVSCPRKVYKPTLQLSSAMVMMTKQYTLNSGGSICMKDEKFEFELDYIS